MVNPRQVCRAKGRGTFFLEIGKEFGRPAINKKPVGVNFELKV